MADNVNAPSAATDGPTFAADNIASVLYPRAKVVWGADGTATDTSATDPLPAQLRNSSGTEIGTNANPVQVGDAGGSITVDASNLDIRDLTSASDSVSAVQSGSWSVSVSGTATVDTELPAAGALADNTSNPTTPSIGTFPHWYDGSTWDRARGDSSDGLLVNLGSNNDVTVTGSVTANAGTNLNTSALALETTATSIKTAVELLDDAVYTDGTGTPSKGVAIMGTDGTNPQLVKTDAAGELQVDVLSMPTTTVQATNLDIRDLTSSSDSVAAVQSGTWNVNNVSGTVSLPSGASTLAEQQTQTTALQLIDDVVHSGDATASKYAVVGAVFDDAATGTVTENNAHSLRMSSRRALLVEGVASGTAVAVSAASLPLPSGASTAANQTTIIGHLDGVEGLLTTIDADTGNISTKIDTLAGAVSGTEMQVDVLTMPTTTVQATNLDIRDLTSASDSVAAVQSGTWNIGTVTTVTNVVHVDDNAGSLTVDAPVGTPVFVRLSDGASAISTLPVSLASVPSHAVTNAGTFAVQVDGSALTALQTIDNIVLAEDAAHGSGDSGVMALAVRKDSGAAIAGTDGDYSPLQVDSSGNLRVNIAAGGAGDGAILDGVSSSIKATVLDYTNSNPIAVRLSDTNGDYVAAGAGTQYTEDAAAAADPVGSMVLAVRKDTLAAITSDDGDNIAARATNKGELYVKHADSIPVTDNGSTLSIDDGAGSITVDGTVAATQSGTWDVATVSDAQVQGKAAHDAVVSGNPVLLGAYAKAAAPTDVSADGDVVRLWADLAGRLQIGDGGGTLTVDDGGSSLTVDGTVAATQSGTWNVTNVSGTVSLPTGASTLAEQQSQTTHLATIAGDTTDIEAAVELIDDTVATLGTTTYSEATTKGLIIGAVRRDADTTLVDTTNEISPLQVDANGRLKVEAFSGETLPVSLASVPSHAVTNAGTFAVQVDGSALTALQLIDDGIATTGSAITTKGMAVVGTDGTNARILKTDTSGELQVDVLTMPTTTVQATNLDIRDLTSVSDSVAAVVAGDVAHDAADSGNPVKMGGKAANALPTAVANGDRTNLITDLWGRALISHIDPGMQVWKSANYTSTQTGATIWDPASGKKIAVTSLEVSSYGTTAARVIIFFAATADTTYSAGTDQLVWAGSFAPSSTSKPGMVASYQIPKFAATADHELKITTDAAISLDITVYGYEF